MAAAVKPVDYEHLQCQAAGDVGVMREVLTLFVTHCEQVLAQLGQTDSPRVWKQWTHTLKGSARGIGAFAVADAAADAERHSLDKSKLVPLHTAFEAARAFIRANPV